MKNPPQVILASASPRRKLLLSEILNDPSFGGGSGSDFKIFASDVDETIPKGMNPIDASQFLATKKANAVRELLDCRDSIVIGCDTIVSFDSTIYGKPESVDDAVRILTQLSGSTHQVITGVCILFEKVQMVFHDVTDVTFRVLTQEEVQKYAETGEPMDKAGAYAIQGGAKDFVLEYNGEISNVIGLPQPILREKLLEIFTWSRK